MNTYKLVEPLQGRKLNDGWLFAERIRRFAEELKKGDVFLISYEDLPINPEEGGLCGRVAFTVSGKYRHVVLLEKSGPYRTLTISMSYVKLLMCGVPLKDKSGREAV